MSLHPSAVIVARKLKQQGFTNAQVAGVLGNFQQESGFNSRVNEGGVVGAPAGRGGFGMGQWTGERQKALINFAKQRKMDPGDAGLQADFLVHELIGPEKAAAASLRQAKSPEQAALVFRRDFERAGIPKDDVRMSAARGFLPKLGTLDQGIDFSRPQLPGDQRSVEDVLKDEGIDVTKPEEQKTTANTLLDAFKSQVMSTILPGGIMGIINPLPLA